MSPNIDPPLIPKNGCKLKILAICRISTINQDEKSLADQEAEYRHRLASWTECPLEMVTLASQGSGENLERKDYLKAIELVETGEFDLVIVEDMGRLCRRVHAHIFAETCEDQNTRLIALNDHIDTAKSDWRLNSYFAVMRHETYNRDTAARIRRTLRNRFAQGGVFQFILYGYVKKPGGSTEADVSKDPVAEPIYDAWFRKLESGANYSEIADWLNEQQISPGPFSRSGKWTGHMVARVTHNPLLKGVRVRNEKMSRRINKTGKHISIKAPLEDKLERQCPHLAFIEPQRYDRVIAMLKARNICYKRKGKNGVDPLKGVPKKRTIWPGQHLRCGICHRLYYWYGVGQNLLMKCSGNQTYRCWNGVEINGKLASQKLTNAISQEIMNLPGFDDTFIAKVRQEWQDRHSGVESKKRNLERSMREADQKIAKITDAIAAGGHSRPLLERLKDLEQERVTIQIELSQITSSLATEPKLPSLESIKKKAIEVFTQFAAKDPEIGRLMNTLIPDLHVYPVQLCDGGAIVLRARLRINLAALTNDPRLSDTTSVFTRELIVDLFDPPQREQFRQQVVAMRAKGMKEQEVADRLGITRTAAQRAAALQRKMDALGLTDPYVPILEPTSEGGFRRHLHARYTFDPLK